MRSGRQREAVAGACGWDGPAAGKPAGTRLRRARAWLGLLFSDDLAAEVRTGSREAPGSPCLAVREPGDDGTGQAVVGVGMVLRADLKPLLVAQILDGRSTRG